ncbi:MAG: tetratricopeptide repeat protein [Planctomycetes bacterium]|nr:tetratricopeptide repeat protein [Planctomycetota bacterium]
MRAGIALLYLASGAAALAYETVWFRHLRHATGSSAGALGALLAAYLGGLALGAWAGAHAAGRVTRPLRLYGLLEAAVGAYAWVIPVLFASAGDLACLWVLPATAALGATFPLVCAASPALAASALYALNTAGAVGGTLVTAFVLLPAIGLAASGELAGALGMAVGAAAWLLDAAVGPPAGTPPSAPVPVPPDAFSHRRWAVMAASMGGLAAMLLQVAWGRVLSLVIGGEVYAVALTLATYLAFHSLGTALGARMGRRGARPWAPAAALVAAGIATWAATHLVDEMPWWVLLVYRQSAEPGLLVAAKLLCGSALLAPAALALGAAFSLALRLYGGGPRGAGQVYAVSACVSAGGALLAGLVLVPAFGILGTALAAAFVLAGFGVLMAGGPVGWRYAGFLALGALFPWTAPRWDRAALTSGAALYAAGVPDLDRLSRASFDARLASPHVEVLAYEEGEVATVSVERVAPLNTVYLRSDGKVEAAVPAGPGESRADLRTPRMLAHLPLAAAPGATRVLVVGLGSGVTAWTALGFPGTRVDCVEIEPAVGRVLARAEAHFAPYHGGVLRDERFRLIHADARRYLRDAPPYDVIISQPSDPWVSGSAPLFTREAFLQERGRLADGGWLCQWVQLYQIEAPEFRSLVAAFREAFPACVVVRPPSTQDVLLLGRRADRLDYPVETARGRLAQAGGPGVEDLIAPFLLWGEDLGLYLGGERANTDDNLRVELATPHSRYLPLGAARGILDSLFEASRDPFRCLGDHGPGGEEAFLAGLARRLADLGDLRRAQRLADLVGVDLGSARGAPDSRNLFAELLRMDLARPRGAAEPAPREADAERLLASAERLLREGRHDEAAVFAQDALRVAPRSTQALRALGEARLAQGRPREALDAFERARTLDPADGGALERIAGAALAAGDPGRAVEALREALGREGPGGSHRATLLLRLARACRASRDREGAQSALRMALEESPDHPAVLLEAAELAQDGGRAAEAVRLYRRFLAVHPQDPRATEARRRLGALEPGP